MSENAVSKNHLSTKESASRWTTKNNSSTTSLLHPEAVSMIRISQSITQICPLGRRAEKSESGTGCIGPKNTA